MTVRAQPKHSAPVGCGSPVFSTSNSSPLHSRIGKFKQLCSAPTILGPQGDLLGKASAPPAPWRLFFYTDVKQKPTEPSQPCSQPPCYKAVGSPTIFPEPCRYFSTGFTLLNNHQNNTAAVFARKSPGCNLRLSRLNLPGGGSCSRGGGRMGHPEPAVRRDRSHWFVPGVSLNTGCEHTRRRIPELLQEPQNKSNHGRAVVPSPNSRLPVRRGGRGATFPRQPASQGCLKLTNAVVPPALSARRGPRCSSAENKTCGPDRPGQRLALQTGRQPLPARRS